VIVFQHRTDIYFLMHILDETPRLPSNSGHGRSTSTKEFCGSANPDTRTVDHTVRGKQMLAGFRTTYRIKSIQESRKRKKIPYCSHKEAT